MKPDGYGNNHCIQIGIVQKGIVIGIGFSAGIMGGYCVQPFFISSWLDPKKVRDMAIVGDRKMLVYDDLDPATKVKIYDMRVEEPNTPHESRISYHYGDMWAPYISPDEPLRIEADHFIECILTGETPMTCGAHGLELVCILTAASESMRNDGINVLVENHLPRDGQLIGK